MEDECIKCGYIGDKNKKFGLIFCNVCYKFCPNTPEGVDNYINEKIEGNSLNSFRKYSNIRGQEQKHGMISKASQGKIMSRAPFGYEIKNGSLIPAQNSNEINEIFDEFLQKESSLHSLAEKHHLSVNGLKKILSNFAYIGKIKFNNQIYEGNQPPIISPICFNKVQDKLEKIKKKLSI